MPHRTGRRSRTLAALARRFGPQLVLPTINTLEQTDSSGYVGQEESRGTALPSEERSHARLLQTITAPGGGIEGGALAQLEGRHRVASGNALRAAVLGANDGLLSSSPQKVPAPLEVWAKQALISTNGALNMVNFAHVLATSYVYHQVRK